MRIDTASEALDATPSRVRSALSMLTTLAVALASSVVLTLAGCASSAGIAPTARVQAPAGVAADAAQVGAFWEIDFFGRHRAAIEAAVGSQRAARADADAARALLASKVARSCMQLARLGE